VKIKQEEGRKEKTNLLSFSLSPVPYLDDDAARRRTSVIAIGFETGLITRSRFRTIAYHGAQGRCAATPSPRRVRKSRRGTPRFT
jgi:hypothetical protein